MSFKFLYIFGILCHLSQAQADETTHHPPTDEITFPARRNPGAPTDFTTVTTPVTTPSSPICPQPVTEAFTLSLEQEDDLLTQCLNVDPCANVTCYKKEWSHRESNSSVVTNCTTSMMFGCFEQQTDLNMVKSGCRKEPCPENPLWYRSQTEKQVRRCCNKDFCNNLHMESSLFQPDLPKIKAPCGRISCVLTINASAGEYCDTDLGCYMLYERSYLPKNTTFIPKLIDRGCITYPMYKYCSYNNTWIGDFKAHCCYDRHYCNDIGIDDTNYENFRNFNKTTSPPPSPQPVIGQDLSLHSVIPGVAIIGGVILISVVLGLFLWQKKRKTVAPPRQLQPPRLRPSFVSPPVVIGQSESYTQPIENVRF